MKTCLILQISWLLLLLAGSSEGTFFEYPKKALTDFFQSLRDKKEGKKMLTNIHHFHVHYYPTPVEVVDTKPFLAPEKTHLDKLHSASLRSLGWTDQEFPIPDPKLIFPSKIQELWNDQNENSRKMWSWDNDIFVESSTLPTWKVCFFSSLKIAKQLSKHNDSLDQYLCQCSTYEDQNIKNAPIPRLPAKCYSSGETNPATPVAHQPVVLQVPFHQQIVFQQPAAKEEKKLNFLTAFFQKLRRIKNALFHEEKPHDDCEDRKSEATITNKLNGYVVYVNSKVNQRL